MWKKFYKTSVLLISLYDIKKYYRAVKIEFISNIGFRGALHFVTHENCILIFFFLFCTGSECRYYGLFPVGIVNPFRIPSAHDNKWISSLVSLLPVIHSYCQFTVF